MPKRKRSESHQQPGHSCVGAMLCFLRSPLSAITTEVRDIILFSGSAEHTLSWPEYRPAAWLGYVSDRKVAACLLHPQCVACYEEEG